MKESIRTRLVFLSVLPAALVMGLLADPSPSFANTNGLVASWHFDEKSGRRTTEAVSGKQDPFVGHLVFDRGVRGRGLKFDGFTSRLSPPATELPKFGPALTVEAWVAPQEYSWAWTGIVDHDQDARAGFFLGLNHLGQVGFYAAVDGRWLGCDSKEPLLLLPWAHVAGTFDPASGFTLYVNGQRVGAKEAKGDFTPAEGLDLLIGMAHRKQFPALPGELCVSIP